MIYEQRVIIRFFHGERVDPNEISRRPERQFGRDTYSWRSVQRWCQLSDDGRDIMHDASRPGMPEIDHFNMKILACLQRNPFTSTDSLVQDLNVALATIFALLHNSLRINNFCVPSLPHHLTDASRATRVQKCIDLRSMLQVIKRTVSRDIVTGDGSWFYLQFHHSTQSSISRGNVNSALTSTINTPTFGVRDSFTLWI
jgi:hypothetical protein